MSDHICPVCGAEVAPDDSQCPRCGFKLVGATQSFQLVETREEKFEGPGVDVGEAALVVIKGPHEGETFYIDRPKLSIGRDPKCEIFLNDMTVSREHAILTYEDDVLRIEDLGSLNGTWVNGKIVESATLENGSVVQIGTFDMVVRWD